jgi:GWxTD domain-containing protein
MIKKLAIVGLFCALSLNVQADDWPGRSAGALQFFVDQAAFKGSTDRSLVEFYLLLEAAQLQYVPDRGKFVSEMDMSVSVRDSSGQQVGESHWTRHLSVDDLSKLSEGGIPYRDVTGVQVQPGSYDVVVSIEDMFGDKSGQVTLPISVPNLAGDQLSASDLILASSVKPAESKSKFTKFGFDVIPNTTRTHLLGEPLQAYVELYNLAPGEDAKSKTFVLGYSFTDTSGVAVKSFPATRLNKPGVSAVKRLTAETEGLRPGRYFLEIEAFDSGSRQHVKRRRSVRLASQGGPAQEDLTEDQLRQLAYYRAIKPLAAKGDLKVLKQLKGDDQAQMKFLRQFWKRLDPTPGTDINERLIEHLRRMRHTDDAFSGRAGQPGSETHTGRVYIQYGAPDDVERNISGGDDTKPLEIWNYGRYEFVFKDRNSLGHYELVHSNYPGELSNPMWQESAF